MVPNVNSMVEVIAATLLLKESRWFDVCWVWVCCVWACFLATSGRWWSVESARKAYKFLADGDRHRERWRGRSVMMGLVVCSGEVKESERVGGVHEIE